VSDVAEPFTPMNNLSKNWFAIYTKPRCEKKVNSLLVRKGIESWCPLQKMQRQWSDRKKIVEEPLFKSYVFVKIKDDEKVNVLRTDGVLNFVYFLGKPALIKETEINIIKSFLLEKDIQISVQSSAGFKEEDKVIISHGIFMDNTGTVVKAAAKKIYVRLESLDYIMTVEFPAGYVSHYFPGI